MVAPAILWSLQPCHFVYLPVLKPCSLNSLAPYHLDLACADLRCAEALSLSSRSQPLVERRLAVELQLKDIRYTTGIFDLKQLGPAFRFQSWCWNFKFSKWYVSWGRLCLTSRARSGSSSRKSRKRRTHGHLSPKRGLWRSNPKTKRR